MPELAAGFFTGFLVAGFAGLLFTFLQLRKYKSSAYIQLQANLAKVNLRWNDLEGSIGDVSSSSFKREYRKARTTYLIFTAAAMLFSWLGLIFLILLWVSVKKLIRNRLEENLFASDMARLDLSQAEVTKHWEAFKELSI